MTLLEAVVAVVVLGVAAVVSLDLSRGASAITRDSAAWERAVAVGESALAEAVAGTGPGGPPRGAAVSGPTTDVTRRPWGAGVDRVDVTVRLADGRTLRLARLVPATDGVR
jgi:type II secretory pathway pseudopilin PulG